MHLGNLIINVLYIIIVILLPHIQVICLLTCTQIVILTLTRFDIATTLGILIILTGHIINYVVVACTVSATLFDKAITGGAVLFSALVLAYKVRTMVADLVPEYFI